VQAAEVSVATNTATILWTTEGTSTGSVVYGRDLSQMNQYAFTLEEGMEHSVILNNLEPGTEYYYRIGTETGSFFTLGRPPIRFMEIEVGSITKTSVVIEWKTNLATNYELKMIKPRMNTNKHKSKLFTIH
jgi:hypothetical protein